MSSREKRNFGKSEIDPEHQFSTKTIAEREEILPEMVRYALARGVKCAARKYNTYPKVVRNWINKYQEGGIDALKYKYKDKE